MDGKAAPAAADVEHLHPGREPELGGDEIELHPLGLLEGLGAAREDRAAVGHRVVEEQTEEVVADVVVVADRRSVTLDAVQAALQDQLDARAAWQPAGSRGGGDREAQPSAVSVAELWRLPLVDDDEGRVEVVDGERSLDVGATDPEGPRSAQEVRQRPGTAHQEGGRARSRRRDFAAIPEADVEGALREHPREFVTERGARCNQRHLPTSGRLQGRLCGGRADTDASLAEDLAARARGGGRRGPLRL